MNKKIFMFPMAVLAMGLASCNQSWPSKTIDDADVIGKKIATNQEWTNPSSDAFNALHASISSRLYNKIGKGYSESITTEDCYSDAVGCYYKEVSSEQEKSEGSSGAIDSVIYDVIINDKGYSLTKHDGESPESDYTGKSYDINKDEYAKQAKAKAIEKYIEVRKNSHIDSLISEIKNNIESSKKSFEERYNKAEKISFTYSLSSKDDNSIDIKMEGKIWNFTKPSYITSNEQSLDIIDYGVNTTQVTIEDCHLTSYSMTRNETGKMKVNDKEYAAQLIMERKMNCSFQKPSHDSINLNDYIIVA